MKDKQKQTIIKLLEEKGYTDGLDVSTDISLFEYGIIRNPVTGHTIFALVADGKVIGFDYTDISLQDVKDILKIDIEQGYFDYSGESKESTLKRLNNDHLIGDIDCIRSYQNFWDYLDYNLNAEDIISMLEDLNQQH